MNTKTRSEPHARNVNGAKPIPIRLKSIKPILRSDILNPVRVERNATANGILIAS
jgi:hypothetical protein